jgi:hypothetical protein
MDSMSGPPDDRPTVGESAARALYEQAAAEAGRESDAVMHDSGFAVYLTDGGTGLPLAIFAHAGHALAWAEAGYPGRYRIEPIDWRADVGRDGGADTRGETT